MEFEGDLYLFFFSVSLFFILVYSLLGFAPGPYSKIKLCELEAQ